MQIQSRTMHYNTISLINADNIVASAAWGCRSQPSVKVQTLLHARVSGVTFYAIVTRLRSQGHLHLTCVCVRARHTRAGASSGAVTTSAESAGIHSHANDSNNKLVSRHVCDS